MDTGSMEEEGAWKKRRQRRSGLIVIQMPHPLPLSGVTPQADYGQKEAGGEGPSNHCDTEPVRGFDTDTHTDTYTHYLS